MAKANRYDEGGVTEGANANIGDDTRARAMAWLKKQQEGGEEAAPAKPAVRRSAPAAKSAPAEAKATPARRGTPEDIPSSAPAGWKGGSGERVSGSELSRNVENTLNAMGPTRAVKVARAATEIPAEMRANRAAQQAYNNRAALRRAEEGLSADEAKAMMRRKALSEADTTGGAVGYKKGGSVKGWGIARGARKAKIV